MHINNAEYKSVKNSGSLASAISLRYVWAFDKGFIRSFLLLGASNNPSRAFHMFLHDSSNINPSPAFDAILQDSTKWATEAWRSLS